MNQYNLPLYLSAVVEEFYFAPPDLRQALRRVTELETLANCLSETVKEKSIALTHQKKANKSVCVCVCACVCVYHSTTKFKIFVVYWFTTKFLRINIFRSLLVY